jgi:short-subunit dehydrogenase
VLNFTEALWHESRTSGLRVLSVAPGATATEFGDTSGPEAFGNATLKSPAGVVDVALRELARRRSRPSVVVGRMNHLTSTATRFFTRRRAVILTAGLT